MSRTSCEPTGVIREDDLGDDHVWSLALAECLACDQRLGTGSYSVLREEEHYMIAGVPEPLVVTTLRYFHHECYLDSTCDGP
jgi:hypothetical protein